jgi:hypothetical protein
MWTEVLNTDIGSELQLRAVVEPREFRAVPWYVFSTGILRYQFF